MSQATGQVDSSLALLISQDARAMLIPDIPHPGVTGVALEVALHDQGCSGSLLIAVMFGGSLKLCSVCPSVVGYWRLCDCFYPEC